MEDVKQPENLDERKVTSLSLTVRDKIALERLAELLRRSNSDTVVFLIWTALEKNYPVVYEELKNLKSEVKTSG